MATRRSSLPARRTRLIGRDDALTAVRDLVRDGPSRLITLTGTGGAGKTALALEVARQLETTIPDGSVIVDLTAVTDPEALALACCEALGLVDQGAAPDDLLARHLAPRHILVVLDNCEHLVAAVGSLTDRLLDVCPDLRVLATSRTRLRVRDEAVFTVGPLAVPGVRAADDSGQLADVPAIALFVERARAADPGFTLEGSASAVASICRRLAGLPLAIELAAAQVTALAPTEIEDRLSTLMGAEDEVRGTTARQRTMETALGWSHDLLDPSERALFRRLAVFRDGWTLDAAEAVCSFDGSPDTIASTLVALVDHSLVVRDGRDATSRFRMLAPVAEYAARQLAASGELVPTSMRHAQHHLAIITRDGPDWREIEPDQLQLIASEHDNCLAAMRFAEREGLVPLVLGFNVSLLLFWRIRGLLRTGLNRLHVALSLVDDPMSTERGLVLAGLAHYSQLLGDLDRAATYAAEAEAILAATRDVVSRRTVIGFLGDIAADRGDLDGALAHYGRARELIEPGASGLDVGFWHANVGRLHVLQGDLAGGERELGEALSHLRSASRWYQGHVLVQLGSLARRRGELDRADGLLTEALTCLRPYGAAIEVASCLDELARLALDRRDAQTAATLFAASTGSRDATGWGLRPDAREDLAEDVERARSLLPAAVFAAAWGRGRVMRLEDVVRFLASPAVDRTERTPEPAGPVLTPREREVARHVALGLTNRQIAEQLVIAPGTARIHVERILGKLGLTSRVQIATWVVREPDASTAP